MEIPYSCIHPTGWCDPDGDDDGRQQLTVTSSEYQHYSAANRTMGAQHSWRTDGSSTTGGGGVMVGFAAFGASGGSSSSSSQAQGSSQYQFSSNFKNAAKNLSISLEYMLATIARPWLVSDLFCMQNWYLAGNQKGSISDGTENNQAGLTDIAKLSLLPMIPQQMLLVRKVKISSSSWAATARFSAKLSPPRRIALALTPPALRPAVAYASALSALAAVPVIRIATPKGRAPNGPAAAPPATLGPPSTAAR